MSYRTTKTNLDAEENVVLGLKNQVGNLKRTLKRYAKDMEMGDEALAVLADIYQTVPLNELLDEKTYRRVEVILTEIGVIR